MSDLKISLAAARVNANMTQAEVAEKLGISNKTLVNWENGNTDPSFSNVMLLSKLYNIPIENIFLQNNLT